MNKTVARILSAFLILTLVLGLFAVAASAAETDEWVKVTEAPADWSGTYLIVVETEDGAMAFDSSLEKLDAAFNNTAVTAADGKIVGDYASIAVTIEATEGGYTVKAAIGQYIGNDGDSNKLITSEEGLVNTITLDAEQGILMAGAQGATLRFNPTGNQMRFRYFKASTYTNQLPIQLYKLTEAEVEPPVVEPPVVEPPVDEPVTPPVDEPVDPPVTTGDSTPVMMLVTLLTLSTAALVTLNLKKKNF